MAARKVLIVHGIATHGGSVKAFGDKLAAKYGYDVRHYQYEKRHFWSYWFRSNLHDDGASLLHSSKYEAGMDVIAHSNGQIVVQSAVEQGAQFGRCIFFSAAGTSDKFVWPNGSMEECHWFCNTEDIAVRLGSWLPWHPFGNAGRVGYVGIPDPRHTNHKYTLDKFFNVDHSFWFKELRATMMVHVNLIFQKKNP